MTMYDFLFYLFAAVTLFSAFFVVTTKSIIYSAFNLLLTFFGVAGLYVLLAADFLAIVQLIIYIGGILVLLIFGVMLTNKMTAVEVKTGAMQVLPASIVIGMFAGILIAAVTSTPWHVVNSPVPATTVTQLGRVLLNEYLLIFELLGMLLLIALIGAANIARK